MRTVFVIGAGANTEIGMPTSDELKMKISRILDLTPKNGNPTNSLIYQAIYESCRDDDFINSDTVEELVNTAINVSSAMPLSISIDNYIEAQKGEQKIALCGKLAIVNAVLKAERDSSLFKAFYKHQIHQQLNDSWYPLIFQKITEGCNIDELTSRLDDMSFIIFNYDRCFEYFMYNSLMVYYNIDHDKAKDIILGLHINHPYGTVGELWDYRDKLAFGIGPNPSDLYFLSMGIKTFTESVDQEKDSSNRIQYLIQRANRIIFLGFAYHEQNMNLLFNHHGALYVADGVPISDNVICYGTGHGIFEKDLKHLCNTIQTRDKRIREIDISNVTCSKFFHDFQYRLSFKLV
jgi:hypothetical protein